MSELYNVVDRETYKNILDGMEGVEKITVALKPGEGVLDAGTIIYKNAAGLYAPCTAAACIITNDIAVLAETVNTSADVVIAENAAAFIKGKLLKAALHFKNGDTITAANLLVLRNEGITVGQLVGDETFETARVRITYKANNGTEEPDYIDAKDRTVSYTVLANTVTGFTAPASKAFSKWNTKADGSGTDYAAAASYATDTDLTLYAVYA